MLATSFGDSFQGGVETFFRGIPSVIGALVILVIGWFIAGILGRVVRRVLDRVGADRLLQRAGVDGFLRRAGVQNPSAGLCAGFIVTWWIRLIVLETALPALGISAITVTLNEIVAYIPSVFAALLILVVGAFLARIAADATRGAARGAGLESADALGAGVNVVIIVLVAIAALQQVHIAEALVTDLLIAVLAAGALALGLAFGLGGRDVAGRLLDLAYSSGQDAQRRIASRPRPAASAQPEYGRPVQQGYGQPPAGYGSSPAPSDTSR